MQRFFENIPFSVENIKIAVSEKKYLYRLIDPHVHSYWEMKVFTEGFKNSDKPVIVLIPPNIIHGATQNLFSKTSNASIAFSQPNIVLQKKNDNGGFREYYISFSRLDILCPGGINELLSKVKDLLEEEINPGTKENLLNKLLNFLLEAINTASSNESLAFSVTERACNFIERSYYQSELTVEEIAAHVGVTAGHLANLFKKEKLGTVRGYLIKTRLKNAERLLATGHYTVKDVTGLTGWNSQFYFSNCFRKLYKIPPSVVPVRSETTYIDKPDNS